MAYTALYRKWRPLQFDDVKGQDHIVTTLKNQLESGRVGHAYLFCGTRGTGKTTVAKILARAVNCEHPVNGSPCNECASCKAILAGASMNVVEIDAASNNGVENIREIREEVQYSPTSGKYRVYIIDEVHMLSTGAFNALLKTLEEPTSYVIFILATTEVQKIPITVLSRCQRYDFRRIVNDTIYQQLKRLTDAEGVETEEKALRYVAKAADGSMRDSLSLLEQCIAFYFGKKLTYENVLEVLGSVDTGVFSRLLRMVAKLDVTGSVALLDEISAQGRDLVQFVTDFIWYLRNLLLLQTGAVNEDALDMSADNIKVMKEEALMVDTDTLMRYIRIFSELSGQMKNAAAKRVLLEIALIRLMKPAMEEDVQSLRVRIGELEDTVNRLAAGGVVVQERPTQSEQGMAKPQEEVVMVELEPAAYEDFRSLQDKWPEVCVELPGLMAGLMKNCSLSYDKERGFVLLCDDPFTEMMVNTSERLELVNQAAAKVTGKKLQFKTKCRKQGDKEVRFVIGDRIPGIEMDIGEE